MDNLSPSFVRISGKETRQIHLYLVHLFPIISPGGFHSNYVHVLPSTDIAVVFALCRSDNQQSELLEDSCRLSACYVRPTTNPLSIN